MRNRILAPLILLVAFATCNDSSTAEPDASLPPPPPPPAITATVPADGAKQVAPETQIQLTFSRAVDTGTLEVTVDPANDLADPIERGIGFVSLV